MRPETVVFREFRGLQTALGEPAPNSAKNCRNLVRNRRLGDLELGVPYGYKFPSDIGSSLPQVVDLEKNHWLDPAIHKISNLVFENIHNFYVPEHGGRNITVAIGTYRKTAFFPGSPTLDRSGVFVRPYWDGLTWVDAWRELSEMFTFEITSINSASAIPISVPNTGISTSAAVGTVAWAASDPAHPNGWDLFTDDAYHRKLTLPAGAQSHYLIGQQISLGWLPGGVTITGIRIRLLGRASAVATDVRVESLQLTKNGSVTGVAKTDATTWNLADEEHALGAAGDMWSASFTSGDTLGFFLTMKNYAGAERIFYLNRVVIDIYTSIGGLMRFNISEGAAPYDFATLDPEETVFNGSYFNGWTIAYDGAGDNENYDLVKACGFDGAKYFLEIPHLTSEYASSIAVGRKIHLHRNFLTREMPSSLASYCHNVLNEMRLTTGGAEVDQALMAGFRKTTNGLPEYAHRPDLDELVLGHAGAEDWPWAVTLAILGPFDLAPPNDGQGDLYRFKYAIVYDDGSRGRLYDAVRVYNGVWERNNTTRILGSAPLSGFRVLWSPGAFPKRGRGIAIYMSNDDVYYDRVQLLNLVEPSEAAPELPIVGSYSEKVVDGPSGLKHCWAYRNVAITLADFHADIPEAQVDAGRSIADAGIIRYTQAAVIGSHAYAVGVYANGRYQPNRVYSSSINGDGVYQYDNFPDDPIHALSVEYNDADAALAVIGLNNRIAVAKKRSLVLLRFDPSAGYVRDVVTKGWGIASARTLVEFDGDLYWLDYAGVMKFNEGGIQIVNREWLQDLLDLPDAVKEAAIATFDRNNKLYILRLNGLLYILDLLTGEWMIDEYNDVPERFSIDNARNRVDFLAGGEIFSIGEGIVHNGGQYTFSYESNEIDRPGPDPVDLNLLKVFLRYRSTVDFTLTLYRDDTNEVIAGPLTVSKDYYRAVLLVPREKLCTSFRWKVQGTAVDQFSAFRLQRIGFVYQPIEITGDVLT